MVAQANGEIQMVLRPESGNLTIGLVKLLYYLATVGIKCMKLLKAYYYDHFNVSMIAVFFGYSGTHSATVAKYKCLEKVRETIKQNSLSYAGLLNNKPHVKDYGIIINTS